jgi:hypothetical protein
MAYSKLADGRPGEAELLLPETDSDAAARLLEERDVAFHVPEGTSE